MSTRSRILLLGLILAALTACQTETNQSNSSSEDTGDARAVNLAASGESIDRANIMGNLRNHELTALIDLEKVEPKSSRLESYTIVTYSGAIESVYRGSNKQAGDSITFYIRKDGTVKNESGDPGKVIVSLNTQNGLLMSEGATLFNYSEDLHNRFTEVAQSL